MLLPHILHESLFLDLSWDTNPMTKLVHQHIRQNLSCNKLKFRDNSSIFTEYGMKRLPMALGTQRDHFYCSRLGDFTEVQLRYPKAYALSELTCGSLKTFGKLGKSVIEKVCKCSSFIGKVINFRIFYMI